MTSCIPHLSSIPPADSRAIIKNRVYISGPIAHYGLEERKAVFKEAAKYLRKKGYTPVNPFDNPLHRAGRPDADWREHMREDMKMLLRCDYIAMLPDWELSKGAKLELDVASSCGIRMCPDSIPLFINISNFISSRRAPCV